MSFSLDIRYLVNNSCILKLVNTAHYEKCVTKTNETHLNDHRKHVYSQI